MTPCRRCQDTGRVMDYSTGESRFIPCRACSYADADHAWVDLAFIAATAIMLTLILAAWFGVFGDLHV